MERILVIDDDPGIRRLLSRSLAYEGFAVTTADTGDTGLHSLRLCAPQLLILDVMMPPPDGLALLRRLREAGDLTPVLMLTALDSAEAQVRGLELGADDYVVKPFSLEVLLARIRALLRRSDGTGGRELLQFADLRQDTARHQVYRGEREVHLTAQEFRLLRTFLEQPTVVLSKDTLLDLVWGLDYIGDGNVVEVYIKQLRQKLEAGGEGRLIHTIRGVGYVLRGA